MEDILNKTEEVVKGEIKYNSSKHRLIPENWDHLEFDQIAERSKKKLNPKISEKNFRCIELEHINQVTGSINGFVFSEEQKSIKNSFRKGDVLFGKLRPYLKKYWLAEFDGVCSSEIWVLKTKKNISSEYLYQIVQSNKFIQTANVTSGSKMPRADWEYISQYPFLVPPPQEQLRIVNTIQLWNSTILILEQQINQKQLLKKGLMQQLLTGKKRLPGFCGEWKQRKLGFYLKEHNRKVGIDEQYEVLTSAREGLIKQSEYYSSGRISEKKIEGFNIIPPGFMTYRSRSDDKSFKFNLNYYNLTGCVSKYYPVFSSTIDTNFFYYFLNYNNRYLSRYAVGSSQLVLSFKELLNIRLSLPEDKEQIAIANILLSADREIELLKKKKKMLQKQKKGLMQQFLTGKKRIPSYE